VAKPSSSKKGRPVKEVKEFDEEVIQIDRVTRVVKGGRRLRFRATVVVGNRKGKVGIGIGKSTEVQGAIQKAISQAKKSLIEVPIVGQTIPHRIQVKFKSAKLLLLPACPGTGIIAGGPLRKVIELAGIQDVLSKSLGCNNRVTNTQAAFMALSRMQPLPWIAKASAPVQPAQAEKQETGQSAKNKVKTPVPAAAGAQGTQQGSQQKKTAAQKSSRTEYKPQPSQERKPEPSPEQKSGQKKAQNNFT
jgi:small subunit ribosomal protein S5